MWTCKWKRKEVPKVCWRAIVKDVVQSSHFKHCSIVYRKPACSHKFTTSELISFISVSPNRPDFGSLKYKMSDAWTPAKNFGPKSAIIAYTTEFLQWLIAPDRLQPPTSLLLSIWTVLRTWKAFSHAIAIRCCVLPFPTDLSCRLQQCVLLLLLLLLLLRTRHQMTCK